MDVSIASQIISKLSGFDKVQRIEFLDKGYFSDKKFALWEPVVRLGGS